MLEFSARYDAPPTSGALAPLRITLPDGTIQAQAPDASAGLSAVLGRPVSLERALSDQLSHTEIDPASVFGDVPTEQHGQILWASILSFLALPPWIAFMYRAWPRTKGIPRGRRGPRASTR